MSADAEDLADRIGVAISGELPGEMVTRWVLAAEVIGPDGERAVWVLAPGDSTAWDSLGLLEYAMNVERGQITADTLRDPE